MIHIFKKHLQEYLFFSKRERRGLLMLITMGALILFISSLIPKWNSKAEFVHINNFHTAGDKISAEAYDRSDMGQEPDLYDKKNKNQNTYDESSNISISLFQFDPNTANADEWRRLGVKASVVQTIIKYREKGGSFQKPEDLRRIFGLSQQLCDKLIPYVRISESVRVHQPNQSYPKREKQTVKININKSGIEDWKMLQGIGEGYAKRIINFREKLGGFFSIEQVGETYGLPDSVFQKIKVSLFFAEGPYRIINLNLVETEDLKTHPYINFNLARTIISYRNQHGNFETVEDIKKLGSVDVSLFNKLSPYLSVK